MRGHSIHAVAPVLPSFENPSDRGPLKPHWAYSEYGHCWDYRKVARPYHVKVAYYRDGKRYWKNVKKVRYVTQAFNACDVHHY